MKHFNHMEYSNSIITISLSIIMCVNRKQFVNDGSFIPAKYSLADSITQHLKENNPFPHDF